jgi:hypothetical protein
MPASNPTTLQAARSFQERCNFRGKLMPDATAKEITISRQGSHLKPLLMGTIAFAHRGHIIARLL